MMSSIRGRDTRPEMTVRRALHAAGFRYRLHDSRLPGKPDLVFPRHRVALFVHGCFWHRHEGCPKATTPATRPEFWQGKFDRNVERDGEVRAAIRELGWTPLVVWECDLAPNRREQTIENLARDILEHSRNP